MTIEQEKPINPFLAGGEGEFEEFCDWLAEGFCLPDDDAAIDKGYDVIKLTFLVSLLEAETDLHSHLIQMLEQAGTGGKLEERVEKLKELREHFYQKSSEVRNDLFQAKKKYFADVLKKPYPPEDE